MFDTEDLDQAIARIVAIKLKAIQLTKISFV